MQERRLYLEGYGYRRCVCVWRVGRADGSTAADRYFLSARRAQRYSAALGRYAVTEENWLTKSNVRTWLIGKVLLG